MKCHCLKLFYVVCKGGALAPPFKHTMQASRIHHLTSIGIPKGVFLPPYFASRLPSLYECHYSTSGGSNDTVDTNKSESASPSHKHTMAPHEHPSIPPAPTSCCMSGCQNCVWLQYAEDVQKILHCSSEENKQLILEKISDPNMRAFLEIELTFMTNECRYRPRSDEEQE